MAHDLKDENVLKDEFVIEMGYSRKEFIRNFSSMAGDLPYQIKQNTIQLQQADRQLLITLGADQPRKIASLTIPRIAVTFQFSGYSTVELERFMENFRRHYHKGGG